MAMNVHHYKPLIFFTVFKDLSRKWECKPSFSLESRTWTELGEVFLSTRATVRRLSPVPPCPLPHPIPPDPRALGPRVKDPDRLRAGPQRTRFIRDQKQHFSAGSVHEKTPGKAADVAGAQRECEEPV